MRSNTKISRACPRCEGSLQGCGYTKAGRPGWWCPRCHIYIPDWLARIAGRAGVREVDHEDMDR